MPLRIKLYSKKSVIIKRPSHLRMRGEPPLKMCILPYIFLKQWTMTILTIWHVTLNIPIIQCDAQNDERQIEVMAVTDGLYADLV